MADVQALIATLARLLDAVDAHRPDQAWQVNARATIRQNVSAHLDELSRASDPALQTLAVCRVSGIRKGISDLGLFGPDHRAMKMADRADTLATALCTAMRNHGSQAW